MDSFAYDYNNAKVLQNFVVGVYIDKISMLEATKSEQEIVINKLQTEVVKLKEKVRHLCKLRQDLLEQRSQVEERVRSVQRERDQEINSRDNRIRELEDELEQYECKMEYLEHTQVHLQRSLLASENKMPKLLEDLQRISADLSECKDELKEKNQRIHELASSVMTKEAMIERLQDELKKFKKEAAQEMENRFLVYTEEKERLMSQLQEETEEYVKAAFAEKDCQLRELNEEWQAKYDELNEEMAALRKELDDAVAEKNDLLVSRSAHLTSDSSESSESDGDSTTSSASDLDWQVQERVERFRDELSRIHFINTIEERTKFEKQAREIKEQMEHKMLTLKKQHEEELREFDQLLNDELNRVHKKYQTELRRLREQQGNNAMQQGICTGANSATKVSRGVQAFVGIAAEARSEDDDTDVAEELQAVKQRLSDTEDELKVKENEVLRLRTEASSQIRNVELYWQERLEKESKELRRAHERAIDEVRQECAENVKKLTDKINSLQTIMRLTGAGQPSVAAPIIEEPSSSDDEQKPHNVSGGSRHQSAADEDGDSDSIEEIIAHSSADDDEENADSAEEATIDDDQEVGQDARDLDDEHEIEIIEEEIIEFSPACSGTATASSPFRHNPLVRSPSLNSEDAGGVSESGAASVSFPRPLLKKWSLSGQQTKTLSSASTAAACKGGAKRVSFAEDRGDLPTLLRYNPDISCMDILRPLGEQFSSSKKKRSSLLRRSVQRSQAKSEAMAHEKSHF